MNVKGHRVLRTLAPVSDVYETFKMSMHTDKTEAVNHKWIAITPGQPTR